mmetsp:Transcript_63381/g.183595  ORF Transcript_63381/g.183595 Transcript_63381/m.183595 type:complete len:262 (-) Transcript_63381:689-1474(-)
MSDGNTLICCTATASHEHWAMCRRHATAPQPIDVAADGSSRAGLRTRGREAAAGHDVVDADADNRSSCARRCSPERGMHPMARRGRYANGAVCHWWHFAKIPAGHDFRSAALRRRGLPLDLDDHVVRAVCTRALARGCRGVRPIGGTCLAEFAAGERDAKGPDAHRHHVPQISKLEICVQRGCIRGRGRPPFVQGGPATVRYPGDLFRGVGQPCRGRAPLARIRRRPCHRLRPVRASCEKHVPGHRRPGHPAPSPSRRAHS